MIHRNTVGLCAAAVLTVAGAASASQQMNSSVHACANIRWSDAFLKRFPKAAAACRDVTAKDGAEYARFDGRVSKVGPAFVRVDLYDVASIPISAIAFKIGVGGTVEINDQVVQVRNLKVNDRLTIWVRDGQFGTLSRPSDQRIAVLKPEATFTP